MTTRTMTAVPTALLIQPMNLMIRTPDFRAYMTQISDSSDSDRKHSAEGHLHILFSAGAISV